MSSEIAVKAESLGKCHHIYEKPRDRLLQMLVPGGRKFYREFWALKGISFEIAKGETVGVVGRNGSGKSTLLQLVCGTLNPTEGRVVANGRIAALLELGSGFSPEFTGRENLYTNAMVMGLSPSAFEAKLEGIVGFADIGNFLDQPVKSYSSGMVMRLAFALAVNVDPQILVIDEALSVGDERFQRKCFAKIERIREDGATILFVSHSGASVIELCNRAILIDAGEMLTMGAPNTVVGKYQKLLYAPPEGRVRIREEIGAEAVSNSVAGPTVSRLAGDAFLLPARPQREPQSEYYDPTLVPESTLCYESCGALIEGPHLLDAGGARVNHLNRGATYRYTYNVTFAKGADNIRFGMLLKTVSGFELGGASTAAGSGDAIAYVATGSVIVVEFRLKCSLNPGVYFLNAGVLGTVNGEEVYLHRMIDACMFRVLPEQQMLPTGIVDFECMASVTLDADVRRTTFANL